MKYALLLVFLAGCDLQNFAFPNKTPVKWSVYIEGYKNNILLDNLVIGFGNFYDKSSKSLLAIDIIKKKIAWQVNFDNSVNILDSQITGHGDTIFVYVPKLGLHVYSKTGLLLTKIAPPDSILSNPYPYSFVKNGLKIDNQILYVPLAEYIYAYDISIPEKPKAFWERKLDGILSALAIDKEGIVYVGTSLGSNGGELQALNSLDGKTIWEIRLSPATNPINYGEPSALMVMNEKVISAMNQSFTIQAFDKASGKALYTSQSLEDLCPDGQGSVDEIEKGEGNIFVSPNAGTCVYGINADTGKVLWTHSSRVDPDTSFTYGGTPKYVNGVVYASNSALWALDAKTGKVLSISSNRDDDALFTNVQYANGEILVWGKNLTAYKPIR